MNLDQPVGLAEDEHANGVDVPQAMMALPPAWDMLILNKSGRTQNYAVYAEVPVVNSTMKPLKIYNKVIAVADNIPSSHGTARFTFRKQLQALCGRLELDDSETSDPNGGTPGSVVEVMDRRPVDLGIKNLDGTTTLGTQWSVNIVNKETPTFSTQSTLAGNVGAFSIKTGGDFNAKDAKSYHFFVGFASTVTASIGPFALFVPTPNQIYQITPVNTFYLLVADLEPRSVVTDAQKSDATPIKFDEDGLDSIKIVHDENGKLTLQKPNSDLD